MDLSGVGKGSTRPKADPFLGAAGVGVRLLDQALQLVEFSLHGSPHRRDRHRGGQGAPPKSRPQRACHLLQSPPRPFYGRGYLTRPAMPQTLLSRPQRTAIAPAPVPDPGRSNNSAVQHRGLEQANPRELPIIERAVSAPGRKQSLIRTAHQAPQDAHNTFNSARCNQ